MVHVAADWPRSRVCSGVGCGAFAFLADLTVEDHGEDHAEDLQREETHQRSKSERRPSYSKVKYRTCFQQD